MSLTVALAALPFAPIGPDAVGGAERIVAWRDYAVALGRICPEKVPHLARLILDRTDARPFRSWDAAALVPRRTLEGSR